jgi:hypothetical protein
MNKNGYMFDSTQCRDKMNNLKSEYKVQKDKTSRSGAGKCKWLYFDIMQGFMGDKPEINPVFVMDSNGNEIKKTIETDAECDNDDLPVASIGAKRPHGNAAVVKNSSSKKNKLSVPQVLHELNNDANNRHKERMKKTEEFLEILKALVSK